MNDKQIGSTRTGPLRRRRTVLLAGALSLGVAGLVAGEAILVPGTPALAEAVKVPGEAAQMPSFADVVAAVEPAVVSIRVKAEARPQTSRMDGMPRGGPFEWFREFGPRPDRAPGQAPGLPNRGQRGLVSGQGSGFFISGDGYVVTNNHVVDRASEVKVTMGDGTEYDAKVVGVDEKTDVALLKVDAERDFPYVTFDAGDIRVGEWVVAVGNPFGLGGSVTAGIISARGRDIGAGPYDDFIQIDAPINRGNSGGPTFNLRGEVVGVNTAIYSPSGGSVGIGFAIPAATVEKIVADLKDDGSVTRGWLGVQIQRVNAEIADSLGLQEAKGALVSEPQADSPALKAGIKAGDTITAVDGNAVNDPRDLARRIAGFAPDTDVKITVWRDGKEEEITVKLGTLPTESTRADASTDSSRSDLAQLGLSVAPAASVGLEDRGLAVVEVDPDGPAAERGVQVGDVIVAVGGQPVTRISDVTARIDAAKGEGRKSVLFQVRSGENTRYVALPIDKA
jgi:serine protease Do